jgi:hypothetical protein
MGLEIGQKVKVARLRDRVSQDVVEVSREEWSRQRFQDGGW